MRAARWENEKAMFRVPEELAEYKRSYQEFFNRVVWPNEDEYERRRRPGMPATRAEFVQMNQGLAEKDSLDNLRRLVDHSGLIDLINVMVWTVLVLSDAKFELLTSDRPVLSSAGLGEEDAYLMLPIGPRKLFVATKDLQTLERIKRNHSQDTLVRAVNTMVVSHAFKVGYGSDQSQLRFVQNLSRRKFEPIFSRLYRQMKANYPAFR